MTAVDSERIVARLEAFRRRYDVPAVGAAVVGIDTRPVVEAVGQRIRSGPATVSREDLWHIGSCAKSFTAALIGRLIEHGATHWDASLGELFDDVELHPGWYGATLSQLLTHRAGVSANLSPAEMKAALLDHRPLNEQRTETVARTLPNRQAGSELSSTPTLATSSLAPPSSV